MGTIPRGFYSSIQSEAKKKEKKKKTTRESGSEVLGPFGVGPDAIRLLYPQKFRNYCNRDVGVPGRGGKKNQR